MWGIAALILLLAACGFIILLIAVIMTMYEEYPRAVKGIGIGICVILILWSSWYVTTHEADDSLKNKTIYKQIQLEGN
jgi:hypothetical protein